MYKITVLTKLAADLLHLMPETPKIDVSKLVKSPMPGLVKSIACKPGDAVTDGQELCVIGKERLKSGENCVRAEVGL